MYNAIFAILLLLSGFIASKPGMENVTATANDTTEIFKLLVSKLPEMSKTNNWTLSENHGDTVFVSADPDLFKYLPKPGKSLAKVLNEKQVCDCAISDYTKFPESLPYVKVSYIVQTNTSYIVTLEHAVTFPLLHKSGKYKGLKKANGTQYDAKYALKTRCEFTSERNRYIVKFKKENNAFVISHMGNVH